MDKNKKILAVLSVIFLIIVFAVTYDMMSRTTAPWNKKKELLEKYDKDWKK